jgi:antitoxin VapB
MQHTKVFKSGNSWAVRLPKNFEFLDKEIEIFKRGNEVVLREIRLNLKDAFTLLTQLPDDFYPEGRIDTPPEKREF